MHLSNRRVLGPYPSTKKIHLYMQTLNSKKFLNANIFYPMGVYIYNSRIYQNKHICITFIGLNDC